MPHEVTQHEVTIDIDEEPQPGAARDVRATSPQSSGGSATPDPPPAKRAPRTKYLLGIAGLLVVMASVTSAYAVFAGWESTDDAQIDGYVNPISSRVAGYVTKVYMDDNQYVKAGTPSRADRSHRLPGRSGQRSSHSGERSRHRRRQPSERPRHLGQHSVARFFRSSRCRVTRTPPFPARRSNSPPRKPRSLPGRGQ